MAVTLNDDQSTTFSGAVAFGDSTTYAEFAASDDNSSPASAPSFWVKIIDPASVAHVVLVAANERYSITFPAGRADNWTWQVAAASGTADITTLER